MLTRAQEKLSEFMELDISGRLSSEPQEIVLSSQIYLYGMRTTIILLTSAIGK